MGVKMGISALGICAAAAIGCGGAALPADRVAEPREAIRAAHELGADANPQAALHLKLAQDQVAQADQLIRDGDQERASWVLLRADADAELALELTKEEHLKNAAMNAQNKIRDLKAKTGATPPAPSSTP